MMIVTADMVGLWTRNECAACGGSGYYNAWRNHRRVGAVHCYQCGGTDGTYRVDADGYYVSGERGTPGRGWYDSPIPEWLVGQELPRTRTLRTYA